MRVLKRCRYFENLPKHSSGELARGMLLALEPRLWYTLFGGRLQLLCSDHRAHAPKSKEVARREACFRVLGARPSYSTTLRGKSLSKAFDGLDIGLLMLSSAS